MWIEKEYLSEVVRMMAKLEWNYVENLVWVKQSVNNQLEKQTYKYYKKSKTSLLIFRKVIGIF